MKPFKKHETLWVNDENSFLTLDKNVIFIVLFMISCKDFSQRKQSNGLTNKCVYNLSIYLSWSFYSYRGHCIYIYISFSLCQFLSVPPLSLLLSLCLSIYYDPCIAILATVHASFSFCFYLSFYLSIYRDPSTAILAIFRRSGLSLSRCLFLSLSVSVSLSVCLCLSLSLSFTIYLSIYLSVVIFLLLYW